MTRTRLFGGINTNARARLVSLFIGIEALQLQFLSWKWKDVEYGDIHELSTLTKQVDSKEIIPMRYRIFLYIGLELGGHVLDMG